ncbi:MAG TPA: hypothetical protein VLC98_13240 [Phnomibacter sp.]|nr:hypothetical protein [Phnomibacter sp.]
MNWAFRISHKYQALFFLWILLAILLIGHWWNRRQYAAIEKSVSSMYKDRLMPSTWLFQLDAYVYERSRSNPADTSGLAAMNQLIRSYESTYLTPAESDDWKRFKTHWSSFVEQPNNVEVADSLHRCMHRLNALQANVGQQLQKKSQSLLGGAQLTALLEVAIIFVFAIMGFMLARAMEWHNAGPKDAQMN